MSLDLSALNDPGPRPGSAAAGGSFPTLNGNEQALFSQALQVLQEIDSVCGTIVGESGSGLGSTFNGNSCTQCHAQPAPGGSSPGLSSPQKSVQNPQIALATLDGATNTVPSFVTADRPMLEARFLKNTNGTPDGGVHDLYTIQGRSDAPGCTLAQPDFATALAQNNVIFRIPTPVFGLGLVEATPDQALIDNLNSTAKARTWLGIAGSFNTSGNDGTITRFGWKAQNKSLLIFAAEAYNVEQGVSNEGFTQERPLPGEGLRTGLPAACRINPTPEDHTNFSDGTATGTLSDLAGFANFMRLLAPPTPSTTTPGGATSINNGRNLFSAIGCAVCHTASLRTSASSETPSLSNVTANLFSDLEIHHMGTGLNDNVGQGGAGGDQFRTAPLWGLGQRIFFLHDGRTSNLIIAIQQHASSGSEANTVVNNFNSLSASQKQDLLNFLRSL